MYGMTVRLKPEQERLVGEAIEAGLISDAEDVVSAGIEAIRQRLRNRLSAEELPENEWMGKYRAWVKRHPTDTPLLSDEAIGRESIYDDRGL